MKPKSSEDAMKQAVASVDVVKMLEGFSDESALEVLALCVAEVLPSSITEALGSLSEFVDLTMQSKIVLEMQPAMRVRVAA